jgi:hypothetical protein
MADEISKKELEVSYYQALVNAYIETCMERDRSLLTLSTVAIGFLITLFSTIGAHNIYEYILYALSLCVFVINISILLYIFHENKKYIIDILGSNKGDNNKLLKLDKATIILFLFGIILIAFIGYFAGKNKLDNKEKFKMCDETRKSKKIDESFEGLNKLAPQTDNSKSLQGLDKLKPNRTEPNTTQSGQSNSSTTSTSSSTNKVPDKPDKDEK